MLNLSEDGVLRVHDSNSRKGQNKIVGLEQKINGSIGIIREYAYLDEEGNVILRKLNGHGVPQNYLCANLNEEGLTIPVASSGRHLHLTEKTYKELFGEDAEMQNRRDLTQPGQYVDKRKVRRVIGPNEIYLMTKDKRTGQEVPAEVAILGPYRDEDQFEILSDDVLGLGLDINVGIISRMSGDLEYSGGGIKLIGTEDREVTLNSGVIVAKRHVHLDLPTLDRYSIEQGEKLYVYFEMDNENGKKRRYLTSIVARGHKDFVNEVHLNNDEVSIGRQQVNGNILRLERYE